MKANNLMKPSATELKSLLVGSGCCASWGKAFGFVHGDSVNQPVGVALLEPRAGLRVELAHVSLEVGVS